MVVIVTTIPLITMTYVLRKIATVTTGYHISVTALVSLPPQKFMYVSPRVLFQTVGN
jgi:hypothetical protein